MGFLFSTPREPGIGGDLIVSFSCLCVGVARFSGLCGDDDDN